MNVRNSNDFNKISVADDCYSCFNVGANYPNECIISISQTCVEKCNLLTMSFFNLIKFMLVRE